MHIPNQSSASRLRLMTCILTGSVLVVGSTISGCAKSKVAPPRTINPERVSIDDFAQSDRDETGQNAEITQRQDQGVDNGSWKPEIRPEPANNTPDPIEAYTLTNNPELDPADGSSTDLSTTLPQRQQSSSTTQTTNPPIGLELLEAKIGDVNGKPIFTKSFFAPIEDRLIAEASRLSAQSWQRSASTIIKNRLDEIVYDELLRAEALASLTPNQRVGLQAFLSTFRQNLVSENLGSSQLARKRLQEEEGVTLNEALRQKELDTLVQLTLIKEINRRVNVSWRDIQQRYERDIDKYAPPPTAIFRVIRCFGDDTDKLEQINTQLADGTDFTTIAAGSLNNYNADADGYHDALIEESYENTKFFGPDLLNEVTSKLTIGQHVGPVELGSSVYWIKLIDIEQTSISLYDAQLSIQRELTSERRSKARQEYFMMLENRSRVSTRRDVLIRLFEIANERYAPQS
jgi:hypothetical protein